MIYDLQKASMWKRISAFLFDVILLAIVAVGLSFLLSTIFGYNNQTEKLDEYYKKYEAEYGISFDITLEEYEALSAEQKTQYDLAEKAWSTDADVAYAYTLVLNLTLLITSFSILFAYLLLEFLVPLLFGNGQTLGKKIFGIALMRTNGVKVNAVSMFIRTVLGKYTIETMIPVFIVIMLYFNIVGIVQLAILALIFLLQIVFVVTTRTNSAIHDMLASTVAVDMLSQMIFDSEEALLEYKKKMHAEAAQSSTY